MGESGASTGGNPIDPVFGQVAIALPTDVVEDAHRAAKALERHYVEQQGRLEQPE